MSVLVKKENFVFHGYDLLIFSLYFRVLNVFWDATLLSERLV